MTGLKYTQNAIRLISINIFILTLLVALSEIAFKIILSGKDCITIGKCELLSYFKWHQKDYKEKSNDLHIHDELLGWKPNPEYSIAEVSKESTSINKIGLRTSSTNQGLLKVLTVGDSFTFGAQVSNNETWQSCLNTRQNSHKFLNGGVNGYGTAQAILRAEKLIPIINPEIVIVSTVVGKDFPRDQLIMQWGITAPSISKTEKGQLKINSADHNRERLISQKLDTHIVQPKFFNFILAQSDIVYYLFSKHYRNKLTGMHNVRDPQAASLKEIMLWSAMRTKNFPTRTIWLLQYSNDITEVLNYKSTRPVLTAMLEANNIDYVDTFDYLHGPLKTFSKPSEAWQGHHTVFGNEIVCNAIMESDLLHIKTRGN